MDRQVVVAIVAGLGSSDVAKHARLPTGRHEMLDHVLDDLSPIARQIHADAVRRLRVVTFGKRLAERESIAPRLDLVKRAGAIGRRLSGTGESRPDRHSVEFIVGSLRLAKDVALVAAAPGQRVDVDPREEKAGVAIEILEPDRYAHRVRHRELDRYNAIVADSDVGEFQKESVTGNGGSSVGWTRRPGWTRRTFRTGRPGISVFAAES